MVTGAAEAVKSRLTQRPPRRILLLMHPNIGDVVNLTAVARWLKGRWPSATVVGCTAEVPAELLRACPFVDEVWLRPESLAEQLRFVNRVRKARFDLSVHCQGQNTLLRLVKFAGVPVRIGVAGTKHRKWLDASVNWQEGEAEQPGTVARLLTELGLECSDLDPAVGPTEADRTTAASLGAEGRLVAFMTGASHPAKRWPMDRFRAVVQGLPDDCRPILVGGRSERGHAREMGVHGLLDLTGKLSVLETMAVLERCDLLVTNDSGPMHLAAAAGTPVVAVFGPTSGSRFAPYGPGHHVLQGRCSCRSRELDSCTGECLVSVSVEEVLAAILAILESQASR